MRENYDSKLRAQASDHRIEAGSAGLRRIRENAADKITRTGHRNQSSLKGGGRPGPATPGEGVRCEGMSDVSQSRRVSRLVLGEWGRKGRSEEAPRVHRDLAKELERANPAGRG